MDASEASKNPGRKDQLFGGLDADRIEMTVGRDLRLPGAKGESINFMVYPYVEVDDVAHSDVSCIYSYREIESNTSATASLDINEASPAASSKQAGF